MENKLVLTTIQKDVINFSLPTFNEIPDVGLYLEQTCQFINTSLSPFKDLYLTNSMISNYVKKGIIEKPIKKRYSRQQIARLIFIAFAKPILSLNNLKIAIKMQDDSYDIATAYQYLREESLNCFKYVYQLKEQLDDIGTTHTAEKTILRNIILAAVHEIYLNSYFSVTKATD
ncbi:DUF1836 domain-containing protein [Lactobacillus psittaci]|uniref:BS ykrK family protein n=1 Tax=Lactobacillus psittaci DSM 15354 TaxID=1122152 RepID=A0A0R1SBI2_9LACO|nr:DUF1836 domain-containing protein [Lactobacillus psittaci]KRL64042.1 hypothetical protein FC23_GL000290 [Lactobacillus psittaci DSM 15354]